MKAEQLDWLQATSNRPVAALRLTNDGAESLPPGVLTLYGVDPHAGASFAGDARLSGLPAGESRLLGFAEDLRTSAVRHASRESDTITSISIAKGVLTRRTRHRTVYTVDMTAPAHDARTVLVEFPKVPEAKFALDGGPPGDLESTASAWRVPVSLSAGQTRHIRATSDTIAAEDTVLLDDDTLDNAALDALFTGTGLDAATRAKLQPLIALRETVANRQSALQRLTGQQTDTSADEGRIRDNLRVAFGPGDLHDKLIAAMDRDETRLTTLNAQLADAHKALDAARDALTEAVRRFEL